MREPRYLLITALVATIFGVSSFYVGQLPGDIITAPTAAVMQNVLASICASFVFLFTLNASYCIRDTFHLRSYRRFFGDLSVSSTTNLVYPDFTLSDYCRDLLKDVPYAQFFRKADDQYPGTRFIDVPKIVASNDLLGIVIMATKIGKYLGDSPRLITDGQAVADPNKSLISFGLTSNSVTDLYQSTDPSPLFRIEDVGGTPKIVVRVNGEIKSYGRTDEYQHGVILRYQPNPEEYPTRWWIICAGLAAAGTPAAAWSLAHKWRRYYQRFGESDFLIVFKTSNDINSYVSSTEICTIERKKERHAFDWAKKRSGAESVIRGVDHN